MDRVMAKIVKIDSISPIKDADAIEVARVGGWNVVIRKGEYNTGDFVVYCEIDSWIPHDIAPFLSKGEAPKEYNGVKGNRLRTIKLRGIVSQGLILPRLIPLDKAAEIHEGMDVSELLGIQKYEPPIPAQLAGEAVGLFPYFIPKTDQERVQNLTGKLQDYMKVHRWEITEKLDGSSMTVFLNDGEFGVCSRNLQLRETEGNSFWKITRQNRIEERMKENGYDGYAIQGELIGEGIQGNPYKIKGQQFFVFDIYNINTGKYLRDLERVTMVNILGLKHVPILMTSVNRLSACDISGLFDNIDNILEFAEGTSELHKVDREGIVFKSETDPNVSFKAISNKFLLKEKQ